MCSEPPCQNGFLVPAGDAVRVPANAPGFWWRAARDSDAAAGERVVATVVGNSETPAQDLTVTRTWLPPSTAADGEARGGGVLLAIPLTAGTHVHLEAADTCAIGGRDPFVASMAITPPSPIPTQLGSLAASAVVHGPLTLASTGGGCSRERDTVHVDVTLTLHPTAEPWADLLLYETRVDGARYTAAASTIHGPPPHESWQGRGRDRLFALCEGITQDSNEGMGLAPGSHDVQLVARLPGSDARIVSDTLRVELTCPGAPNAAAAEELYDVASLQLGGLVLAAQLALLIYILLTRSRRRRRPL